MNLKRAGFVVTAIGLGAAVYTALPARGGTPAGATYLGPSACVACHKGLSAAAVEGWQKSAHSKAMWAVGDAAGGQIVGDFSSGAPFPKDQVAYVLGVGTRAQAYLDKNYQVLPGEWDVKSKSWTKREAVDAKTQCLGCHTTGYNAADGSYKATGVGCEMCHGPGSGHIGSSDKKGTITNPATLDPAKRAMVCAQCHSQGKAKDGTHAFPIGFKPGDDLNQTFTLNATVAPESARNPQYNDLRNGGGKHLTAGTVCTTCHEPHGGQGATMLRQSVPDLCLQCHKSLTGAQHSPDALKAVTCTMCHMPKGRHVFVPPHTS